MSSPFVAEMRIFGFDFAPAGWAGCNGQLLPISQNTALFSLLGTFYGGDGKSTFALPNLIDDVPVGTGTSSASGLQYYQGQQSGTAFVTLLQSEIPAHTHQLRASVEDGTQGTLTQNITLATSVGGTLYSSNTASNTAILAPQALSVSGSSLPHNNMMPFLALNICIALQGVFPPRG